MVRRNKLAFAAGTAVGAAVLAGLAVSTILFIQERKAHGRAVAAELEQSHLREEAQKSQINEAQMRRLAEENAKENRNRLVRLHTADGIRLMEEGDVAGSLPFLAEAVKLSQENSNGTEMASFRLRAALDQWPKLVQIIPLESHATHAEFSPDDSKVLTVEGDWPN